MAEGSGIIGGKVTAIMSFGAFVRLQDGTTGLVHISEISEEYVKDVRDFLQIGQDVHVIALATERDGKKRLSIKKASALLADSNPEAIPKKRQNHAAAENKPRRVPQQKQQSSASLFLQPPPLFSDDRNRESGAFEDKLAKFMKESEERLVDVKHQTDNKRGGGYVRRG